MRKNMCYSLFMAAYTPSPDVWNPPQAVIDAGNRSQSQYNPYRRIQSGEETQLRVWPAVKRFRDVVMTLFPGFSSGGMKRSPRREPIVGRVRDPHEEGRAIDFMTRNPSVGDPLANWLVLHSNELGIQLVMWRGTEWSASSYLPKFERITGNPHNDHIHMEFNDTVREMSPEEMERRIRSAFSTNQTVNQQIQTQQTQTTDINQTQGNTNQLPAHRIPDLPVTSAYTQTVEQSEDTPSADVNDENENVTMLSPQELQEKASYIQMIERNKINIAIGVGLLILGGIGFVIYRHKMKQKAVATETKTVKNGRRKIRVR